MKCYFSILLFSILAISSYGQGNSTFQFTSDDINVFSTEFVEINNLILLPIIFNKTDTLYFILDSGAEYITLFGSEFDENPVDTTLLRRVSVVGAGAEDVIEAYVSPLNTIEFGQIIGKNQNIVYIPSNLVKFSDLLGHPVHGILGIPIFKAFTIELNYSTKQVTFHRKETFNVSRKFKTIDLIIIGKRAYVELNMELQPRINLFTTLLLDSGESKPLSLFLNSSELIFTPYPSYYTNLGKGLNGLVSGRVAKISGITLDEFVLRDVVTAFPDEETIRHLGKMESRNGSIGAGILKKFISIIDLHNEKLYIRKTRFYRQPFKYDKTGLIIAAKGKDYDTYIITGVIENSSGANAGLLIDDQIISIDNTSLEGKKIGEVLQIIGDSGRKVEFEIIRNGEVKRFRLRTYKL